MTKTEFTRRLRALSVIALMLLLLGGCASPCPLKPVSPGVSAREESSGWWYARFQFTWPQPDKAPAWHRDLIVAHRIAVPVLERFQSEISLWRFHRRAAPDDSGHQFSFLFHAPPSTARAVFAMIQSSPTLEDMQNADLIVRVIYDETTRISRPGVEGTSDRNWSPPVRKSWPHFIMGVSICWLDLIDQFAEDGREKPAGFDGIEGFYEGVNRDVERAWAAEGGHAFLHHLNALFGYVPVDVRGRGPMRF